MDIKESKNKKINTTRHPWELARNEIIKIFLKKITGNIEVSNISIIDIGCGDLFVLEKIYENFKFDEFFGVDIALSKEDIRIIENETQYKNIKILNNLNDLTIKKDNISIVLLNDVIEHIEDDKNFLADLQKYSFISEKTVFVITVPAFQFLFCSRDTFLEHYRRYTNSQLVNLLENTNYGITAKGYFFFTLLLPRLVKVIKERMFYKNKQIIVNDTEVTNWKGNRIITSLIKNILIFDFCLLRFFMRFNIRIPGLSTFVICKKFV